MVVNFTFNIKIEHNLTETYLKRSVSRAMKEANKDALGRHLEKHWARRFHQIAYSMYPEAFVGRRRKFRSEDSTGRPMLESQTLKDYTESQFSNSAIQTTATSTQHKAKIRVKFGRPQKTKKSIHKSAMALMNKKGYDYEKAKKMAEFMTGYSADTKELFRNVMPAISNREQRQIEHWIKSKATSILRKDINSKRKRAVKRIRG